jgi:hypothetical protein
MDTKTVLAVALSVAASSVVAGVTAFLAGSFERQRQLRERRIVVAGDFAGEAMDALAKLRYYKPTKPKNAGPHPNERLHVDLELRRQRAEEVEAAIDRLRPLNGRVWVTFPGKSWYESRDEYRKHGPKTTADWAGEVVRFLRDMHEASTAFWTACDKTPALRENHERSCNDKYQDARKAAREAVNEFAESAAKRV